MLDIGRPVKKPLLDDMMALARMKLVFNHNIENTSSHKELSHTAVLDVLITIEYNPRSELAREHQEEMVASHMRTAFSIPHHRSMYMDSGYPSEPFLAEAASRQMHRYGSPYMVWILRDYIRHGLADLGQKGDMVMRFFLRIAYIEAIVAEQGSTDPNFSKGCNFLTFLKALFAEGFHASVLGCQPDNNVAPPSALADMFKHAVVRFTHFARGASGCTMTTRGMVMAFLRGAAIIGQKDEKTLDIAIPILLDEKHKIEETSMSAFLIQVKRRHHASVVNAYPIDANKLGFFPKGSPADARPYVTLVAELGVKEPPSGMDHLVISQRCKRGSAHNVSQLQSKIPRNVDATERPRYGLRAFTCSDRVWKVVDPRQVEMYEQMLGVDTLLTAHPRQTEESLQLVRQMLPYWYHQPAWFSDEVTTGSPVSSNEFYEDPELNQGEGSGAEDDMQVGSPKLEESTVFEPEAKV